MKIREKGIHVLLAFLAVGLLVGATISCSSPTSTATPTPTSTATPTPTSTATPTPTSTATITPAKWKFSSIYAQNSVLGGTEQRWMSEITKRTGGAITFEAYWNNSLAEPKGQLGLIQNNTVQVIAASLLYNPGFFPIAGFAFAFPFGPDDPSITIKASRQVYDNPLVTAQIASQKVKVLSYIANGWYNILSKVPINTLGDFKGKKIGLIGQYFGLWMEPVGLIPVNQPAAERYTSMQSGLIDMNILSDQLQVALSIYEQAKYYIDCGLGSTPGDEIMMNVDFFNSLQPELQKIIGQVSLENDNWVADALKADKPKSEDVMKKAGVIFSKLSSADRDKWMSITPDTTIPLMKTLDDGKLPGKALVKQYMDSTTALGYKWSRQWGQ